MDGDDDYMPQMSQLGSDYGTMQAGPPAHFGMYGQPPQQMANPYDPMMHQMQPLHPLGGPPPPQQQAPPPAPHAKTSKSRSKKKETQDPMTMRTDPMAQMQAMSHNPMRTPMPQMPMDMQRQQMMYSSQASNGAWQQPPQGYPPQYQRPPTYPGYPTPMGYPPQGATPPQPGPPGHQSAARPPPYGMPPNPYPPYGAYGPPPPHQAYPQMQRYPQHMPPQSMPHPGYPYSEASAPSPYGQFPPPQQPQTPQTSMAQQSRATSQQNIQHTPDPYSQASQQMHMAGGQPQPPQSQTQQQPQTPSQSQMPITSQQQGHVMYPPTMHQPMHQPSYNPQLFTQLQSEMSMLQQRMQSLCAQPRTTMTETEMQKCEQQMAYLQSQMAAATGAPTHAYRMSQQPQHMPQSMHMPPHMAAQAVPPQPRPPSQQQPPPQPGPSSQVSLQSQASLVQSQSEQSVSLPPGCHVQFSIKQPEAPGRTVITVHQTGEDQSNSVLDAFSTPKQDSVPPEPVPSTSSVNNIYAPASPALNGLGPPQPQIPQQQQTAPMYATQPHMYSQAEPPPPQQLQQPDPMLMQPSTVSALPQAQPPPQQPEPKVEHSVPSPAMLESRINEAAPPVNMFRNDPEDRDATPPMIQGKPSSIPLSDLPPRSMLPQLFPPQQPEGISFHPEPISSQPSSIAETPSQASTAAEEPANIPTPPALELQPDEPNQPQPQTEVTESEAVSENRENEPESTQEEQKESNHDDIQTLISDKAAQPEQTEVKAADSAEEGPSEPVESPVQEAEEQDAEGETSSIVEPSEQTASESPPSSVAPIEEDKKSPSKTLEESEEPSITRGEEEEEEDASSTPTEVTTETRTDSQESAEAKPEEPGEEKPKPKPKSRKTPITQRSYTKKRAQWDNDDDYESSRKRKSSKKKPKKGEAAQPTDEEKEVAFEEDKRRSGRRGGNKSYIEPSMDDFGDEYLLPAPVNGDNDDDEQLALTVERFLGMRTNKDGEDEFHTKWRQRSYMHCEWKTATELEEIDKRVGPKLKRYKQRRSANQADEEFNEDFLIAERVIGLRTFDAQSSEVYVKWKALQYEEATWEAIEDVPADKVEAYKKRVAIDRAKLTTKHRPESTLWKRLPADITWKNGNRLREYQFEGVNWLTYCYYNKQNCILADEMGLGKTVQTITFLSQVFEYGIHGPFLIVVPLSTVQNWVREFEAWTDMNAIVYHGSAASRGIIEATELYYPKPEEDKEAKALYRKGLPMFDAFITTFEMVVTEVELLRQIPWRVCVIDEAHRLKNRNCKLLTSGLHALKLEHRILLTGTPLQNNIEELYSLLSFLHPEKFPSSEDFLKEYGECKSEEQVSQLQTILKPMMLRRLKEDVEKTLQPREEVIIEVQLSDAQKKYYRAILERNFTHLVKSNNTPSLMNIMMELRKCCNHPFLVQGAEEQIKEELKKLHPTLDDDALTAKALVEASGKMTLIGKLLEKLRKDNHRVLVFSQMVRVLDLIEEFVSSVPYPYERIDGNVRGDLRQAAIDRFSKKDSDRFIFLLCTRAGGLGINLTAADTVIIFDSDWNPQNDLQAQARCHRIGQEKAVKVYRLVTANTYEREMFEKASLKLGLDKAVLQSTTVQEKNAMLSKNEVEELLRKGAYGSLMDENSEGSKFSEEDIDTILQRRATTITLEAGIKGSTFSKATFGSSNNTEGIELADPDFWDKWAEKANIDLEKVRERENGLELIVSEPRNRKKRFEEDALKEGEISNSEDSDEAGKKSRSSARNKAKRRREEDDEEYGRGTRPDELAFGKAEFFKVEKFLNQYGWGRWQLFEKDAESDNCPMHNIEHMARVLVLHNLRDFRGDERIRDRVFHLIRPSDHDKYKFEPSNKFSSGWAALPEYNPPSFAVDNAFARHIHRYSNRLITKIDMIDYIINTLLRDKLKDVESDKPADEIDINLISVDTTGYFEKWDSECDKSLFIGTIRHGFENLELIRNDKGLCFLTKGFTSMPTASEVYTRIRRLYQRQTGSAVESRQLTRWSPTEEVEFVRFLASMPLPGWQTDITSLDWSKLKAKLPCFEKKSEVDIQEHLMLIMMLVTHTRNGDKTAVQTLRQNAPAISCDFLNTKVATNITNRLYLLNAIESLCTAGKEVLKKHEDDIKDLPTDSLPSAWKVEHDIALIWAAHEKGIYDLATSINSLPVFQDIIRPNESLLFRRLLVIVHKISPENSRLFVDPDVYSIDAIKEKIAAPPAPTAVEIATAQNFLQLVQNMSADAQRSSTSSSSKNSKKRPRQPTQAEAAEQMQNMLLAQLLYASSAQGGSKEQQQALAQTIALLACLQQSGMTTQSRTESQQLTNLSNNLFATLLGHAPEDLAAFGITPAGKEQLRAMSIGATPSSSKSKSKSSSSSSKPSTSASASNSGGATATATPKATTPLTLPVPSSTPTISSRASTSAASYKLPTDQLLYAKSALALYPQPKNAADEANRKAQEAALLKHGIQWTDYVQLFGVMNIAGDFKVPVKVRATNELAPEEVFPTLSNLLPFLSDHPQFAPALEVLGLIPHSQAKHVIASGAMKGSATASANTTAHPTPVATPKPEVAATSDAASGEEKRVLEPGEVVRNTPNTPVNLSLDKDRKKERLAADNAPTPPALHGTVAAAVSAANASSSNSAATVAALSALSAQQQLAQQQQAMLTLMALANQPTASTAVPSSLATLQQQQQQSQQLLALLAQASMAQQPTTSSVATSKQQQQQQLDQKTQDMMVLLQYQALAGNYGLGALGGGAKIEDQNALLQLVMNQSSLELMAQSQLANMFVDPAAAFAMLTGQSGQNSQPGPSTSSSSSSTSKRRKE